MKEKAITAEYTEQKKSVPQSNQSEIKNPPDQGSDIINPPSHIDPKKVLLAYLNPETGKYVQMPQDNHPDQTNKEPSPRLLDPNFIIELWDERRKKALDRKVAYAKKSRLAKEKTSPAVGQAENNQPVATQIFPPLPNK